MNEHRLISWSSLLSHWTTFAQSALALPPSGEGRRLRDAVPSIIALQAITHALAELDLLPADEYSLGQDRAEITIRTHAGAIHTLWTGEPIPTEIRDLIDDARTALAAAREGGVEWVAGSDGLIAEHPAQLVQQLLAGGFQGDLYLPTPGVPIFEGCPVAFARARSGQTPDPHALDAIGEFLGDVEAPQRRPGMRQAYRQFDFAQGRAVRDLVVPMNDTLPGGQPLLVPGILNGEACAVPLPMRKAAQTEPLPVVFESPA